MLNKSDSGMLLFQIDHLEKHWTTKEIFNYFSVNINSDIGNSGQLVGGIIIIKIKLINS